MSKKLEGDDGPSPRRTAKPPKPREVPKDVPWYRAIGPGLITGGADDDPSGIGTYSATGAQSGYLLLWLVPYCIPLMIAVQEMCGRLGAVTGMGLAAVLRKNYSIWLVYGCVTLLVAANVFNVYADLNVMAASAAMLIHAPFLVCLTVISLAIVFVIILVPYRPYSKLLKWLCLSLLGYVVVDFLPQVHNDWRAIFANLWIPHFRGDRDTILLIVAFLGTTISPYLFFWQANETVEEEELRGHVSKRGGRKDKVSESEIRNVRADTAIGMIVSQTVAFFIVIATAAVLFRNHVTHIETAKDAAEGLAPLGPAAYWIFTLGIIGTGLLAIPTLAGSAAYAISETASWRCGLNLRFADAKSFYSTITVVILAAYAMNFVRQLSPVTALVYSAAVNGIVAPPLIIVLLFVCNNRKIVGDRTNGKWSNTLGWATVALMAPCAAYLVYTTL